ncbi:peptide deformylase [Kitasatospora fiedleri]|uniref:peptide deformylase n=1 Tax=Kitasatospora fiedleri TaxID=2991545 RepID=UPI00384B16DB
MLGTPVAPYPALAPEAGRGRVRRITEAGEDVLHRPCRPVEDFGTPELARLVDDMFRTMYAARGVGLAANQIGVDLRVFVYDCPDDDGVRHVGHLVNPVLDEAPEPRRLVEAEEGCLSVPGPRRGLARPDRATARGSDLHGDPLVLTGTGYFARCLRHETDHLNGLLYVDRLGKRERRAVLAESAEQREAVLAARAERAAALDSYAFEGA